MIRVALLLAATVAVATPALASDPVAPQAQPTAKQRPEDKIICKFVNTTGSRLSRDRECKTRAQWNNEADETGEQLQQQEQRATGEASNGPH